MSERCIIDVEVFAVKVQVNLNDDVVKKIDSYAKAIGVSRSAVCAMWIGNAVLGVDKATETLQRVSDDMVKAMAQEKEKKKK